MSALVVRAHRAAAIECARVGDDPDTLAKLWIASGGGGLVGVKVQAIAQAIADAEARGAANMRERCALLVFHLNASSDGAQLLREAAAAIRKLDVP